MMAGAQRESGVGVFLHDSDGAVIRGIRPVVIARIFVKLRQFAQGFAHVGMVMAQGVSPDFQSAEEKQGRFFVASNIFI